jgi:aryl-alcohol dehydrogenase-like predicted oxidoreductase
MTPDVSRREFVEVTAAGTAAALLQTSSNAVPIEPPMPERPLGRTGHRVRLFSLGGQATLEKGGTREESVAIINRAIDLGVNYIDTAAAYGQGISQEYIGEVMATRRDKVFLATKTHNRTRDGSLELLEQSLTSLHTDHLDLWQLHNVRTPEDLDRIFAKGGAIEALQEARDQGVVRNLGITGHYEPWALVDGLNRFDFDAILMALNAADRHVNSFIETVLPIANEKRLGIIGMKIPARGRMFREGGITSMCDAMCYVLSLPVSTVIVGCDTVQQLEENIAIAKDFKPLAKEKMAELEEVTKPYAKDAAFFRKSGGGW